MTTNNELSLSNYIRDFEKVSRVSNIISQVCELQRLPSLATLLLNKWAKTVLDCQDYGEEAFVMARIRFVNFLKSGTFASENSPLVLFLIDALWLIY